jgi:nucleoside-diphosphate-sugar epimerase
VRQNIMKTNSILFVGCGDLGCRAGSQLLAAGWQVTGLRRDPARLPAGFSGIGGDYTLPGALDFIAALAPDYVVTTFNPSERSEEGYWRGFAGGSKNLLKGLGGHKPNAIFTVSSTRVYAERDGGWVDEGSDLAQDDPRAVAMIAAEQALLTSPHLASAIRFGGIYGAPGGRLLQRIQRGELSPEQPARYSNRIHRDDCAGFLCHLLERAASGVEPAPVYNGVDDLPAVQFEVESWLALQMGVQLAPSSNLNFSTQTRPKSNSPGHKRCSNRLLRTSGYQLLYPDYRSGYGAVLGV